MVKSLKDSSWLSKITMLIPAIYGHNVDLDESSKKDVDNLNSLLALVTIHDFNQSQKEQFAKLMGQMIVIDKDINYNEVKIYNVVNDFCDIRLEFDMDSYPEYTKGFTLS